jgi:hypothetical protein
MSDRILKWAASLNDGSSATFGIPTCPYAKRALETGRVSLSYLQTSEIELSLRNIANTWDDTIDVRLLATDASYLSPSSAEAIAQAINADFDRSDIWVMVDHPKRPMVICGHDNSQGDYLLFFVQRKSKLSAAANALKKTNYYYNWPVQVFDRYVRARDGS